MNCRSESLLDGSIEDFLDELLVKIDANTKELEDPIEVSLSKYKKEIIDSALRYL